MKTYHKAILPCGFQANGIASGIRKEGRLDLALIYTKVPAKAACVFTTNKIQAAPVTLNKEHLKKENNFQAIIVNSGNANCFNAKLGYRDAQQSVLSLARELKISGKKILVASTGIIGKRLPLDKIKKAIPALVRGLSSKGIDKVKRAILTTDTFAKVITAKFNLGNRTVTICGIAKGAGMIAPNMATMLSFILTDADIAQRPLNQALHLAVEQSFNCITVDGCMSTNDSVMLLANGESQNKKIELNYGFDAFAQALKVICLGLAKMIVKDAEGATKFIEINVKEARDFKEARSLALGIANSNLFKTAVFGENPNFGRIAAALGSSGIDIKESDLKIKVSPLHKKEISVKVYLKRGKAEAKVYTSDLTPEYIKINAEYN